MSVSAEDEAPGGALRRRPSVFGAVAIAWSTLAMIASGFLGLGWIGRITNPEHNDFSVFYAAGKLTAAGHLTPAYVSERLYHVEATLVAPHRPIALPFPYPPHAAALFGLLARLPIGSAYGLWTAVNLAAFLLACLLAIRTLGAGKPVLSGLACLGCLPMVVSTAQGESSGLLCLGVMLFLRGVRIGVKGSAPGAWDWPSLAAGVFLLSLKPPLLLVPILVLVARRRPSEMAGAAAGFLSALVTGLVAGGLSTYRQFAHVALASAHWTTQFHWGAQYNYSLLPQLHAALGYGAPATLIWLAAIACVAWLLLAGRLQGMGSNPLAVVALTALLANHFLFHDLAVIYPVAAVALAGRYGRQALTLLIAPWLDPGIYRFVHVHVVVLALLWMALAVALERPESELLPRRMDGQTRGGSGSWWRLFGLPRWGSASGSGTR